MESKLTLPSYSSLILTVVFAIFVIIIVHNDLPQRTLPPLSDPYTKLSQFSAVTQLCPTLCDPMDCMPGFPVHHQLPELAQTHVYQQSHSLSSPSPPAFSLSQQQGLFQLVSSSHPRPKYWRFSFSISPSNEYSVLISFRIDWFDLLESKGLTLKSLLQHNSSRASILWCSAFFMVQLTHPYMAIGKTVALTRWTFVGKDISTF